MEKVFEQHRIARADQGYVLRPGVCGTCNRLAFDVTHQQGTRPYNRYESIPIRSNYRCGLGGFAVITQGTCSRYEAKPQSDRSSK